MVKAQSITTARSQINFDQQWRWHHLIESEWEKMSQYNLPTREFLALQEHFQLNLDESGFMCNDGILKIMGDADRKHHDKTIGVRFTYVIVYCVIRQYVNLREGLVTVIVRQM